MIDEIIIEVLPNNIGNPKENKYCFYISINGKRFRVVHTIHEDDIRSKFDLIFERIKLQIKRLILEEK